MPYILKSNNIVHPFAALAKPLSEIPLGKVLFDLMGICQRYHVHLDNNFATLVVGLLVVEGVGR